MDWKLKLLQILSAFAYMEGTLHTEVWELEGISEEEKTAILEAYTEYRRGGDDDHVLVVKP